jgi:acetolactate synthase I/II/III large subunit
VLSLRLDVQGAPAPLSNSALRLPPAANRKHADPAVVRRLVDVILQSKRPLILGGRGAVVSEAEPALIALADRTGSLLATSVCGHGLFANNPWSLGLSGAFLLRLPTSLLRRAT